MWSVECVGVHMRGHTYVATCIIMYVSLKPVIFRRYFHEILERARKLRLFNFVTRIPHT